ncbi:dipeptidase [Candidatus Bipolaricaulota bacterium]
MMDEKGHEENLAGNREKAVSLQQRVGVVNALEVTRNYAFTPEYAETVRASGVMATNMTLGAPDVSRGISPGKWSFNDLARSVEDWYEACSKLPEPIVALPILSAEGAIEAKRAGKTAIIFGTQGAGYWIDRDLVLLRAAYRLGVRVLGFSYQRRTIFSDGCGEKTNAGLGVYGERLVKEANRLGMVIDLAHTGDRSALDAMKLSTQPVIFSHSCMRTLSSSVRNMTDEQLDALAESGGVVGIASFATLLMDNVTATHRPTVDDFMDHLDYAVQRIGIDHVGIGLDTAPGRRQEDMDLQVQLHPEVFRGPSLQVEYAHCKNLDGPEDLVNVTQQLLQRGYSEQDIEKILSGNFLRVFREVWGQ